MDQQKRPLHEALIQAKEEVRSWPAWKQQLAKNQDFRIDYSNKIDDRMLVTLGEVFLAKESD